MEGNIRGCCIGGNDGCEKEVKGKMLGKRENAEPFERWSGAPLETQAAIQKNNVQKQKYE